jgi:hypothetical protein
MAKRILSPPGHEARDLGFRYAAIAAGLMALALGSVAGAAWLMFPHAATDQYVSEPLPKFAGPLLQSSPRADMDAFRAQQAKELNGLYWIDQPAGVVHLPIADAMRKVAEDGIADWPAAKAGAR